MKENKEYFDLSEYPVDHELHDKTNKKVIGKFKTNQFHKSLNLLGYELNYTRSQ